MTSFGHFHDWDHAWSAQYATEGAYLENGMTGNSLFPAPFVNPSVRHGGGTNWLDPPDGLFENPHPTYWGHEHFVNNFNFNTWEE